jgi:hypothetical protein
MDSSSIEEADPKEIESAIDDSKPIAKSLGVPELVLMGFPKPDEAIWDFERQLTDDQQCVAAAFEARYSPRVAALFKFGAAIAAATVFRRKDPQIGAVWEPEIQTYGKARWWPDALWRPMLEPVISTSSNVQAITDRIDAYIRANP